MARWYRMVLILLLAFGIASAEVRVGEDGALFVVDETTAASELDETLVTTTTRTTDRADEEPSSGSDSTEVTSSDQEQFTEEQEEDETRDNAEKHLTTVFEADQETTTVQEEPREEELPVTTEVTSSTTSPVPRTRGRMVRFGNQKRSSRPTTAEPPRRSTVNSRALLNRRGLFNPELRNRYLARFRSTTTDPNS
ncbi:hypothetical protein ZHAS_00019394 [Anopheles sinensis]|uniref:Uncharacterized protein n=1 Tax=Anopheles sinensis TaxID=74873 RepID=A0A084WLR0_ANOSI|nr:hypothetical protein ZHAS_00019394 [Anopheles sinensis]